MAHIQDGLLSAPVLIGGLALAVGTSALAFRLTQERDVPKAAVLASVFFAGSLVAIPVGPSSVHLMFSGLMGLVLGWLAVPAVLAALILQLVLFGFGGVTTLGINACNIALPGVLVGLALRGPVARAGAERAALLAGIGAACATAATGGLVALSLALSSSDYVPAAQIMVATYLPLMLLEGLVAAAAVSYLHRALPGTWLEARP